MSLAEEAARGASPAWVGLKMAAIGWVHRRAGKLPPHAAEGDVVREALRAIDGDDLRDVCDRALLAFGLASCLRRSEPVALRVDHVRRVPEGLRVTVAHSKTDQEGKGTTVAVPEGRRLKPVARLKEWLTRGEIADGFLFRGLSNAGDRAPAGFAEHSLRAGFLTSAARADASAFKMQEMSRHKSVPVLSVYVRDARVFDGHAGKDFL